MTQSKANILIVEDSITLSKTYELYLKTLDCNLVVVATGEAAMEQLVSTRLDIILLDLKLPDMDGFEILQHIRQENLSASVIVITAHGSVATAVEAMQKGATDFLLKPFNADRLLTTMRNALEIRRLKRLVAQFADRKNKQTFQKFVGESPPMQAVYHMIEDAAPSRASVFVIGESGTGKELAADAIHQLSPRASKPLVALNCAAIPANLIESEIFGHKRGAFTGATENRQGAATRADGGTLFLDEICEMPLDLQSKLLRFIQTGQFMRVGDNLTQTVDVRFVCATNRDPWLEVENGNFREDLYYRLHVIPVTMPPLRDRGEDVIQIATVFLRQFALEENKDFKELSEDCKQRLLSHRWPGNVRELSNVIHSAVVLNNGDILEAAMLPAMSSRSVATPASLSGTALSTGVPGSGPAMVAVADMTRTSILPLEKVERSTIERALIITGGKVHEAAKHLEVNPSTLYRKLKSWKMDPRDFT